MRGETEISPARDFRNRSSENRTQIRAQGTKYEERDHDEKMFHCQASDVRRQAHGTQGSRVEGPEVKRLGQRGVDRDRDRDYGAQ